MGARPYDPTIGRFLEVDPVDGGSANNYDYADQDPINGYDLTGTTTTDPYHASLVGTLYWGDTYPVSEENAHGAVFVQANASLNGRRLNVSFRLTSLSGVPVVNGRVEFHCSGGCGPTGNAQGVIKKNTGFASYIYPLGDGNHTLTYTFNFYGEGLSRSPGKATLGHVTCTSKRTAPCRFA